jgi:hypothetical protein
MSDDSIAQIEKQIEAIKHQLMALGPIHPGSISSQFHACGNPTCRCHDKTSPQKHGPYNKLTFVCRGKSVCRFVRNECVDQLKVRLQDYKTFRTLTEQWVLLSIQRAQIEYFQQAEKAPHKRKF